MKDYHARKLTTTEDTFALLWAFSIKNWTSILLYGFITFLLVRFTMYLLNTYLFHFFKWALNVHKLLVTTKSVLETPYEEYMWDDYEFCKKYLDLYAKFRELRIAAKKGPTNTLDVNAMEFMRFDDIKLCRMKKTISKVPKKEDIKEGKEEDEDYDEVEDENEDEDEEQEEEEKNGNKKKK
uniref:Translocation protein SEC62 n=1 Tax=Parastrongyloides trichosuri TaxID=131310 RepID=A0A0N5A644_PARTI